MRKLMLFIFLLNLLPVKAQVWCTPNAEWYFNRASDWYNLLGYTKMNYVGNFTVNTVNCQKLVRQSTYYSNWYQSLQNQADTMYTTLSNNVVYKYYPTTNSLDTIYNFNANIGDKWSLSPKTQTTCAKSRVTVIDTGHKFIQGVYLKWQKVIINGYFMTGYTLTPLTDTIIERLGSLKYSLLFTYNLCPWATDGPGPESLRCYSDNQIINYTQTTLTCNYYALPTGINDLKTTDIGLKIYPNPANDLLNVTPIGVEASNSKIKIYNSLGQLIREEEITFKENRAVINTKDLANGVYVLTLFTSASLSTSFSAQSDGGQSISKRFVVAR
ncbi:MAG: T9SS type A sorting domain-containing protein [Bacteroidota bacterium]|nr:T9SS type A sorting domain-containing protein [Bacteroidota bacterium]